MMNIIHSYFLDFGLSTTKRISYAASFGKINISENERLLYGRFLTKFDFISVREKSGIALCNVCCDADVQWVPDPTFLIAPDIYRNMSSVSEHSQLPKHYLLLYYLNNGSKISIKKIYRWAQKKKLKVIYVGGNNQYDKFSKFYPSIQEWLYLLDHAEYIITNSFHGSVFSVLFQKKFAVIPLKKNEQMNERLYSLFSYLNIEERFFTGDDFSILEKSYTIKKDIRTGNFLQKAISFCSNN